MAKPDDRIEIEEAKGVIVREASKPLRLHRS